MSTRSVSVRTKCRSQAVPEYQHFSPVARNDAELSRLNAFADHVIVRLHISTVHQAVLEVACALPLRNGAGWQQDEGASVSSNTEISVYHGKSLTS